MEPDKRAQRNLKRVLKHKGGKRRRAAGKRALADDPEAAARDDFDFGRTSSAALNGLDDDRTRRRKDRDEPPQQPDFEPRSLPEPVDAFPPEESPHPPASPTAKTGGEAGG
jgi:hypothetical protein